MTARCPCHGVPIPWCTNYTPRTTPAGPHAQVPPPIGPDGVPHESTSMLVNGEAVCVADCPGWHDGVVTHADTAGVCAICGAVYQAGALVAKMPLPTYGQNYAHAIC